MRSLWTLCQFCDRLQANFCTLLRAVSAPLVGELSQQTTPPPPSTARRLSFKRLWITLGRPRSFAPAQHVAGPSAKDYTELMSEPRVVADHRIMGGVPCVRGTRIPVATIVGLLAQGQSVEQILADYPQLVADDVQASLEFAAIAVSERQVPLRTTA